MAQLDTVSVLFVCLGNICRSPTAHGVFQHLVNQQGLDQRIRVDSAGTGAYHVGASPDHRSAKVASTRGYDLSTLRARQATSDDFERFDYILAMDNENLRNLQAIAPAEGRAQLSLFLEFSSQAEHLEVPDPYYGGPRGFDLVLDLVEDASNGLLAEVSRRLAR